MLRDGDPRAKSWASTTEKTTRLTVVIYLQERLVGNSEAAVQRQKLHVGFARSPIEFGGGACLPALARSTHRTFAPEVSAAIRSDHGVGDVPDRHVGQAEARRQIEVLQLGQIDATERETRDQKSRCKLGGTYAPSR